MRLFIAINFSNHTRAALLALRDELRSRSERGSFSLPENLHLTLAFLGECGLTQIIATKAAMDAVSFPPFDVTVECLGRFKRETGDIWWSGLRESKPLLDLQRELTDKLIAAGFTLEKREYKPHITLGREVITKTSPWRIEPFGETVHKIDLMKSERINGKLTYTSIYRRGKNAAPIVVEPYNPEWAAEFERIRDYLLQYLGDRIVAIHHVGSTSVVGLSAKPIIDFDIEIPSMDSFAEIKERLEKLGYRHEGDLGVEGREAFKPTVPDNFMKYHMYVCPSDSPELRRHLRFRDALRRIPAAADEYGALKTALAAKHGDDIDAYIQGKTECVRKIMELG